MNEITVLRHKDLPEGTDPMGESLLTSSESFKVWKPNHVSVVLGNSQKPEIELTLEAIQEDSIPVYKRRGGGGTVLLSPKGLCYGMKFKKSKDLSIHDYFDMGTSVLQNVLFKHYGIESKMRGISDLAVNDLKILGCSLYLPKDYALFLASILVEDEKPAIARYLAHPSREPDYREGRTHKDFVTSIHEVIKDSELSEDELRHNLEAQLKEEIMLEWSESLYESGLNTLTEN